MICSRGRINIAENISYRDVVQVANCDAYEIYIDQESINRLRDIRYKFIEYIKSGGECYGVTTGLGAQISSRTFSEDVTNYYLKILRQHAAGIGDYLPRNIVRGAMLILARQLSLGFSAASPEVIEVLIEMINRNITPLVPRYGSLGASGDLAPMSYVALAIYGEGLVIDKQGKVRSSREVLGEEGVKIPRIDIKDPISLINNTSMSLSIASHDLYMAEKLLASLVIVASISIEAMSSPLEPFSKDIYGAKKVRGIEIISESIKRILENSSLERRSVLQDRYSFRTIPQVLGSLYDVINFSRRIINDEINSSSDNPLFNGVKCVSGGNFYGSYIVASIESMIPPLTQALAQSERRIFSILDPSLSRGLPPFLTKGSDVGYMIAQYSAVALLNRISQLAYPSTVFTAPTSASQEDHVSNSYNSALKLLEILDLGMNIVSIEYLVASKALLLRDYVDRSSRRVREYVEYIKDLVEENAWTKDLGSVIREARARLEDIVEKEMWQGVLKIF